MEFLLGGIAACGAGLFTNPLEVVKTRMQLQGELKARGKHPIYYKNVFHAFYAIGRYDGVLALQKGLVPALWYQFFMNGFRLGAFQGLVNLGFTRDSNGNHSVPRSIVAGAVAGCIGATVGSPIYMVDAPFPSGRQAAKMLVRFKVHSGTVIILGILFQVKTHLQSMSDKQIAVGHQHSHGSMSAGLKTIYYEHGVKGLWRGVSGAVTRVMVGSAAQLSTFSTAKEHVTKAKIFKDESVLNALTASMASGVVVVLCMTPFDVVSTRLYNQGTDAKGKGLLYNGVADCFVKIFKKEGVWGFYKGWAASLFRLGPHTILSLVFWDRTRKIYKDLVRH